MHDDIEAAAELIYQTDNFLFPFLFGKREKALPVLKNLIELDNNSFSHRHIYCAADDSVAGILIAFDYGDIDKKLEEKDYGKVLSLPGLVILGVKALLLKPLFTRQKKGEFYLQNISVAQDQQGRGIGSLLIDYGAALAAEKGCSSLTLDVAGSNPGARRLYQRKGFLSEKKLLSLPSGAGSCFMRRPLGQ